MIAIKHAKSLTGISINTGIIIGEVFTYEAYHPEIMQQKGAGAVRELARYTEAKEQAAKELLSVVDALRGVKDAKAAIFSAHIDILTDEEIDTQICTSIQEYQWSAEYAVQSVYNTFVELFAQMDDPVIRERKSDMTDISLRLLRILEGKPEKSISSLPKPVIIAAHDLLPSDTATLDRQNVLGILTEVGNATSHTAIIAKNDGIPAILGISGLMQEAEDGRIVAMDAETGCVVLDPDEATIKAYEEKKHSQEIEALLDQSYLDKELQTQDGVRIFVHMNIGAPLPNIKADANNVDGVGLFRTEFLYMENDHLPTEEEQFRAYRDVLLAYGKKPVILRTLDIGGDKSIPYMSLPEESNPFLGVRALRLCYEHQDLFDTQLRAALRASAFGTLQIMFPMVASIDDIRWAKAMVEKIGNSLDQEGIEWDHGLKLGIMMEIPSIMMIADLVAKEVDFASVGTNDLCQYLMASDRLNPSTARYYQSFHPAMFRLIAYAAKEFADQGKQLSICGELGGDPLAVPVLLGLGVRKLSMSRTGIGKIKREVSALSMTTMEELGKEVLMCRTEEEVKQKIKLAIMQI